MFNGSTFISLFPPFQAPLKKPTHVWTILLPYVQLLGLWASSGPFPFSAHLRLYKRRRHPQPNPSHHLRKYRRELPTSVTPRSGLRKNSNCRCRRRRRHRCRCRRRCRRHRHNRRPLAASRSHPCPMCPVATILGCRPAVGGTALPLALPPYRLCYRPVALTAMH